MLCYSFRLILYVYGVLENDGQLIMSGSMMNNPCLGCVEINTNFILYENRNRYFTIIPQIRNRPHKMTQRSKR